MINDEAWNKDVFLPTVGKRGAAIIEARGLSSAASAANAAIDHMRDWALGSNGKWVTMGIPSDGQYGIPKDTMFGFPVTTAGGEYKLVEGLAIDAFSQERINADAEGAPGRAGRRQAPALRDRGQRCSGGRDPPGRPLRRGRGRPAPARLRPLRRTPALMAKSLALQRELGPVFDVTLDCEDGAPVGGEAEHAELVAAMLLSAENRFGRVGARVHPVGHPAFAADVATIVGQAASRLAYLMLPKVESVADVERAAPRSSMRARGGAARSRCTR